MATTRNFEVVYDKSNTGLNEIWNFSNKFSTLKKTIIPTNL